MSETNEKEFYRWLGEQYRLYREKKGLKQKEVATKAGIAPGDLSKFENRGKKLSAYRISRLLEAIGLKLEELFQDDRDAARQREQTEPENGDCFQHS